jgi:hypothetical protein
VYFNSLIFIKPIWELMISTPSLLKMHMHIGKLFPQMYIYKVRNMLWNNLSVLLKNVEIQLDMSTVILSPKSSMTLSNSCQFFLTSTAKHEYTKTLESYVELSSQIWLLGWACPWYYPRCILARMKSLFSLPINMSLIWLRFWGSSWSCCYPGAHFCQVVPQ